MLRIIVRLSLAVWSIHGVVMLTILMLSAWLPPSPMLVYTASAPEEGAILVIVDVRARLTTPPMPLPASDRPQLITSRDGRRVIVLDSDSGQTWLLTNRGHVASIPVPYATHGLAAWNGDGTAFALVGQDDNERWHLTLVTLPDSTMRTEALPPALSVNVNSAVVWTSDDTLRIVTPLRSHITLSEITLQTSALRTVQTWEFLTEMRRRPLILDGGDGFILPAMTPTALNFELYHFEVGQASPVNRTSYPTRNDTQPTGPIENGLLFRIENGSTQSIVLQDWEEDEAVRLMLIDDGFIGGLTLAPDNQALAFLIRSPGQDTACIMDASNGEVTCPLRVDDIDSVAWWQVR